MDQFAAFSAWLRREIEKQAADPTSVTAQEIAEKDMIFDHASVLEYIQGPMTQSQMVVYSGNPTGEEPQWDLGAQGGALFGLYKNSSRSEQEGKSSQKQLPGLTVLIRHLKKQSNSLFDRISETQRRNVRFGTPINLGAGKSACIDMRMVAEVCTAYARVTSSLLRLTGVKDG